MVKILASILLGVAGITFANASTDSESNCFPEEEPKDEGKHACVSLGQKKCASTPLNVDSSTISDSDEVLIKTKGCCNRASHPATMPDRRVVSDAPQPMEELDALGERIDALHRVLQHNEDRLRRLEERSIYGQRNNVKVKNPRLMIKVGENIYFSQNNPGEIITGVATVQTGIRVLTVFRIPRVVAQKRFRSLIMLEGIGKIMGAGTRQKMKRGIIPSIIEREGIINAAAFLSGITKVKMVSGTIIYTITTP